MIWDLVIFCLFVLQTLEGFHPTVEFTIMYTFSWLILNIPSNTFLYFIIHGVLILAVTAVIFNFVYRIIFKLSNEVESTSNRINVNK